MRTDFFDGEEALRRIEKEDSIPEGMSNDEGSDLDHQRSDFDQKMR